MKRKRPGAVTGRFLQEGPQELRLRLVLRGAAQAQAEQDAGESGRDPLFQEAGNRVVDSGDDHCDELVEYFTGSLIPRWVAGKGVRAPTINGTVVRTMDVSMDDLPADGLTTKVRARGGVGEQT